MINPDRAKFIGSLIMFLIVYLAFIVIFIWAPR